MDNRTHPYAGLQDELSELSPLWFALHSTAKSLRSRAERAAKLGAETECTKLLGGAAQLDASAQEMLDTIGELLEVSCGHSGLVVLEGGRRERGVPRGRLRVVYTG